MRGARSSACGALSVARNAKRVAQALPHKQPGTSNQQLKRPARATSNGRGTAA